MHHLCVCMVSLMSILSHDSCVYAYTHVDTVQNKDRPPDRTDLPHKHAHAHTFKNINVLFLHDSHNNTQYPVAIPN